MASEFQTFGSFSSILSKCSFERDTCFSESRRVMQLRTFSDSFQRPERQSLLIKEHLSGFWRYWNHDCLKPAQLCIHMFAMSYRQAKMQCLHFGWTHSAWGIHSSLLTTSDWKSNLVGDQCSWVALQYLHYWSFSCSQWPSDLCNESLDAEGWWMEKRC